MPRNSIYELRITLRESEPPIWRRLRVSSNITLQRLHQLLVSLMGWQDYHLHLFQVGEVFYGVPELDEFDEFQDEFYARLYRAAPEQGSTFIYEYDFGDCWQHEILLERVLPWGGDHKPVCLGGERATPPEDCGGISGYEWMLASIGNPEDPERDEWLTWLGGSFESERFDVEEANRRLKRVR